MDDWAAIAEHISQVTNTPFTVRARRPVGGGCINNAAVIEDGERRFFVKQNAASALAMFEAEAAGLQELAEAGAIRVPRPVCAGIADGAYLVLEYLETGSPGAKGFENLGHALAEQHRGKRPHFGWHRDNTIGSTPQINTPDQDWVAFWQHRRLEFQLELAAANGHRGALLRKGERLLADVGVFFATYSPQPSLLHGDLWSGNFAFGRDGRPFVFDPAVYYGDREADLAMTELFGGFSPDFYAAYRNALPLDPGYAVRKTLYNLYHILNHLNLFGGGYGRQAEQMMDRLLSEL